MLTQLGIAHIREDVFGHGMVGKRVQIENGLHHIFARIERNDVCTYRGVITCDFHAFDVPILVDFNAHMIFSQKDKWVQGISAEKVQAEY